MHAVAVAMLALENGDAIQALKTVETALERIGALRDLDDETFAFERKRSQAALRELQVHIEQTRPVSPLERLERQLEAAIQRQEFEQAAELRDRIRALRTGQPSPQAKQGRQ
jgi:excinuclease UvrABC helicase subunit UvrB